MRRAWSVPAVVVVMLVCLAASSALAASEYKVALDFDGLTFRHLIEVFQKGAPDRVFIAAPGVADLSLTVKSAQPLPLDDAIEAAAGALDLEVHRAGKVVIFRPRLSQTLPSKPPRPDPRASSGTLPVRPWPESFIGSDMLVDLEVKDKSLSEVADMLARYASAHDLPGGASDKPTKRPYEIAVINPAPHPKEIPAPFRVTAAVYRRPLCEVLGYLTDKMGLTYTVEQKPEKTIISIVPRPSVIAEAYFVFKHGRPGWLGLEDYPGNLRPQAQTSD